jgi:hypothetical protein
MRQLIRQGSRYIGWLGEGKISWGELSGGIFARRAEEEGQFQPILSAAKGREMGLTE